MARPVELPYVRESGLFYVDPNSWSEEGRADEIYHLQLIEGGRYGESWTVSADDYWTHVSHREQLPEQGWKIHVSATPENAQNVLELVEECAVEVSVSFKFLTSKERLVESLRKYGDRVQAGKFITLYPANNQMFERICDELESSLKGMEGPDVLTDIRLGEAPVHTRYGAFKRLYCNDEHGNRVPAIRDSNGVLVPDVRRPRVVVPEGISVPARCATAIEKRKQETLEGVFGSYEIQGVLHYSNAGGVYIATTNEGARAVIKEGRPWVGLDDAGMYAVERVRQEYETLRRLENVQGVVNPISLVSAYGHMFLIEEYCDGVPLTTWISQNYPYSRFETPGTYISRAGDIISQVKGILEECHQLGFALMDLQPMNILVDDADNVRIIDLEAAIEVSGKKERAIGTPGFVPDYDCSPYDQDWYAYEVTVANMLVPLVPLNSISRELLGAQWVRAEELFGQDVRYLRSSGGCNIPLTPPRVRCYRSIGGTHEKSQSDSPLETMIVDLVNGVRACVAGEAGRLDLPGDILRFEPMGRMSINHGLAGVFDILEPDQRESVVRMGSIEPAPFAQRGYLSGIDGISLILSSEWERLSAADPDGDSEWWRKGRAPDVSLRTGVSGCVLAGIARHLNEGKTSARLLSTVDDMCEVIESRCELYSPHASSQGSARGLLDGRLGAAVALLGAGRAFDNKRYLEAARVALEDEMESLVVAPDGSVQVLDGNRLLPYVAEGSAGFVVASVLCPKIAEIVFSRYSPEAFLKAVSVRGCANVGLHFGFGGLALAEFLLTSTGLVSAEFNKLDILRQAQMYAFRTEVSDGCLVGGQGGLKLSADFSTGNAGLVKVLRIIEGEEQIWSIFPGLSRLSELF